jgi:hypothetical protein
MQVLRWMEGKAICLIAEDAHQQQNFTQTQFWIDKTIWEGLFPYMGLILLFRNEAKKG